LPALSAADEDLTALDEALSQQDAVDALHTDQATDEPEEALANGEADQATTAPAEQSLQPEPSSVASESNASPKSSGVPPRVIVPVQPPPPLTPQLKNLRGRVRSVLRGYYQKSLNSREHDPWEVMHGMLAYGVHSRIHQGGPRGDLITAVGWLCYNRPCKGLTLLYVTPEGRRASVHDPRLDRSREEDVLSQVGADVQADLLRELPRFE
jgi:hypothetical protein